MSRSPKNKSVSTLKAVAYEPVFRIGAHVSSAGGFSEALARATAAGLETMQMFTSSPHSSKKRVISASEIKRFKKEWRISPIENIYVHTPYYINAGSPVAMTWRRSLQYTVAELKRMERLGLKYYVMHVGSHLGAGVPAGQANVSRLIKEALRRTAGSRTVICLENTAGQKNDIGADLANFGKILSPFRRNKRVAAIMDTCHLFAAGYDLRSPAAVKATFKLIDRHIGFDNIPMLHINDSKVDLGGARDRHEHLGKGFIGLKGFAAILSSSFLRGKDLIVETKLEGRPADIKWLKSFRRKRYGV